MGTNNPNLPNNVLSDEEAIQYLASIVQGMRTGLYTAVTGSPTLTAAQMVGGVVEISGGSTATVTGDTAANIIARMQALDANAAVGSFFTFRIVNDNSGIVTFTPGANCSITAPSSGGSIPAASSYAFLCKWATATTITMVRQ